MPTRDILSLPVARITSPSAACFLWVTSPHLQTGLDTLRAWGFRYSTVAFCWAKRTPKDNGWHVGMGYSTRSNVELCLLGLKGSLPRISKSVRQLIVSPVGRHSEKPQEVHERIEELYGDLPRLELFARTPRPNWTCLGNEIDGMDILGSLNELAAR